MAAHTILAEHIGAVLSPTPSVAIRTCVKRVGACLRRNAKVMQQNAAHLPQTRTDDVCYVSERKVRCTEVLRLLGGDALYLTLGTNIIKSKHESATQ